MFSVLLSRLVILCLGILYPAYASYKAIRTKSPKDYVKWMMYWVVFSLFLAAETFTDIFLAWWFPFYYEIKVVLVVWLMLPATRGSSILYRKFVHPMLTEHEPELDAYIERAKTDGYSVLRELSAFAVRNIGIVAVHLTNLLHNMATKSGISLPTVPSDAQTKGISKSGSVAEPNIEDEEVLEVPKPTRSRRNLKAQ